MLMAAATAAIAGAFAPAALAATEIPPGKWSFVFADAKGRPDRPIRVYTYRPRDCDSKCPIQFVMHGEKREASVVRDEWELLADRFGLQIVAPEFAEKFWEGPEAYTFGDVANQADRAKWAYAAVEHLFDEVRDGQAGYNIFGHAEGAQFAQRMLLLLPGNRIAVAGIANAGWYLLPEWRADKTQARYPYALAGSKSGEAEVRAALARRVVVTVGEAGAGAGQSGQESSGDGASKQGANRVERAENLMLVATGVARELGVKLGWELNFVPGVGFDRARMERATALQMYAGTGK